MTPERRVLVHPDVTTLTASVAARFITNVVDLISERPDHLPVDVCLTGGGTGIGVLAAIAATPARDSVDWSRLRFWWGDERYLPRGDADRNDTQAREALLGLLPIDESQTHPMPAPGEQADLAAAADAYAADLAAAAPDGAAHPVFDITFLGVGPDGHIASLFPDRPGILETGRTVIAEPASPKPPPERISLTLPVINASERVWLVLAGPDKAGALGLALADANIASVPVAGVLGRRCTLFCVDRDAAAEVPEALLARQQFWTAQDG